MLIQLPPLYRRRRNRIRRRAEAAPTPPPGPAVVVSTAFGSLGIGGWATLTFDQPIALAYPSPTPDGSITLAGIWPSSVTVEGTNTLRFESTTAMYTGATWSINNQPGWVTTALNVPQYGYF